MLPPWMEPPMNPRKKDSKRKFVDLDDDRADEADKYMKKMKKRLIGERAELFP
jgi:hypothetical protein